jgi:hypothetical protein
MEFLFLIFLLAFAFSGNAKNILVGKPLKKNRFKRFCASSISLSGFHVVTLLNVFIYFTFLD